MSLPFDPPKLNPWPFVLADLVLLGAAYWIGATASAPASPAAVWAVVVCVGLGALLVCVPLVVNYTRKLDLALAERQKEIGALAETTAASAEQISIAVAGLTQVVDAAHRATKHAEQLPHRLQEKVNDFKAQLNEVAVTENEALAQELNALRTSETERLEVLFDRIQKVTTDWTAAEQEARLHWEQRWRQLSELLSTAESRLQEAARALPPSPVAATSPAVVAVVAESAPRLEVPATEPIRMTPSPAPSPDFLAVVAETDSPAASVETQEEVVVKKRSARRAAAHDDQVSLGLDLGEDSQELAPSYSLSSDGLTRVLATAYIGIGNKLFIRGRGAGLSLEHGTPMQFISIGKWRWQAENVSEPLSVSFWKNDKEPAIAKGEVGLDPGQQMEIKLTF